MNTTARASTSFNSKITVAKKIIARFQDHNTVLIAAGVSFWLFLSIFPTIIAAINIYDLASDPETAAMQIKDLTSSLPQDSRALITNQIENLTSGRSGALSLGLIISILTALWSASGGIGSLIEGINIAYNKKETRKFLIRKGIAVLMTLGAIASVIVMFAAIAVFPAVVDSWGLGMAATILANIIRWVGLIVLIFVGLAVLYRFGPNQAVEKIRWISAGGTVAALIMILGSVSFSLYATYFGSYNKTYGAIAGVVIFMMWLYINCVAVLMGATINSYFHSSTHRVEDSTELR